MGHTRFMCCHIAVEDQGKSSPGGMTWHNRDMPVEFQSELVYGRTDLNAVVNALVSAGALFALVHGSQINGSSHANSDLDIAAYFSGDVPLSCDVLLPIGVDLSVLNDAPLEFKGRIAAEGHLLFETQRGNSVEWVAFTRKVYFDERFRFERFHREFLEALSNG